jgi:predicted transcriptional regulator of viral defense system
MYFQKSLSLQKNRNRMTYLEFRNRFIEFGAFSMHQVNAVFSDFSPNNFTRWQQQGLIVKLRQGFYAFQESILQPNFALFLSNFIYKPSYISLYTALAFYGIIPEAVTQITAVSSLKTADFQNNISQFSYKRIKPDLLFGYVQKPFGNRTVSIATPEKSILDLLYLYPFYNTESEIENLRFDEDFVRNDLNTEKMALYLDRFNNKKLTKRVEIFRNLHEI